jgi:dihydropteroate synthase
MSSFRPLPPPGRARPMGVLNLTPDSFSDGGRDADATAAIARGVALVADGAAILDVGAVSTRPGAPPVSVAEEWRRLSGVLAVLHREVDVPLSLDTSRADVLRRALDAGAVDLLNDVSALGDDPALAGVAADAGLPVVLMHRRGSPADMQIAPHYDDAPAEVCAELLAAVGRAVEAGLAPRSLLLDPGIGFGKRPEDNLALLAALPRLVALGHRTVLGCSRKAFLGLITGAPVDDREHATTATTVLGALAGIDFLRVHDVRAAAQALAVVAAVSGGDRDAAPLT